MFFAVLKSLGVGKGDSVMVEGFTCVAVVDAILATGAIPVYLDIEKNFQVSLTDFSKKLTKQPKVLILQHSFGIDGGNSRLFELAKKHKIPVVEDMAHGIGIQRGGELLGTKGIATIFSFGRDKAFSSINGGIIVTNNKTLSNELKKFQDKQPESSKIFTFQSLFHLVSFYFLILPLYDTFNIGKLLLVLFQKLHLLDKPIDNKELEHFESYATKFPDALARIALIQLERIDRFNSTRERYVDFYKKSLKKYFTFPETLSGPLLRFPLLIEDAKKIKALARRSNVYLGDWYSNVIDPKGTDVVKLYYKGDCPTAEYIAKHIVNLPTYPTLTPQQAEKVVTIVSTYVTDKRNYK